MGTKGWIIFAAAVVVLLGGLVYLSGRNRIDVSGFNRAAIIGADEKNGNIADHVYGNKDAKVVFIEYGDFQCPGCASANSRIKVVVEKYSANIAFVFRNLPLTSIHPNARAAAAVAEAAGQQGKYWEMHSHLYDKQAEWQGASTAERTGIFNSYAQMLGLDLERFSTDIASAEIAQKINFDLALARADDIQATPSFLLNGEPVEQDIWGSDEALEKAIKDALEKAGVTLDEEV